MDRTDRMILRELQANARLTNNELAQRVNLSPSPCLRRLRRLEQEGVIAGYTAVIDQEKYGLPINVFVLLKLEKQTDGHIRTFEAAVAEIDEILECYLMTGTSDYLLHIVSDSLKSYERFIRRTLTRIPGIGSIESSFAFGLVKKKTVFPRIASIAAE